MINRLFTNINTRLLAILLFFNSLTVIAQVESVHHWETIVYSFDIWTYFVGTHEPDTTWRKLDFNDSSWLEGRGGIGYGDNDDSTVISPAPSLYQRNKFIIQDTSIICSAVLHVDYDDAFVAYLNDKEIARANIGVVGDFPPYNQSAATYREAQMYQGGKPEAFVIEKEKLISLLKEGENVLAVQVHNYGTSSSDLSSIIFLSLGIKNEIVTYGEPPDWFYVPKVFSSSNLPVIMIETFGQAIPDEPRIIAHMGIVNNPDSINYLDDPFNEYNGRINIEIRGSSSQMFPKKSYSIETQDSLGENLNVPLLGMPEENDWVLYAPYSDKSLMRNVLTYKIWNDIGHYGPGTKYCELFINNEYKGIYVLTERIKRDKNRVNIAKLTPDDISGDDVTGGYIIKVDKTDEPGIVGWTSVPSPRYPDSKLNFFQYYYPKYEDIMPEQDSYIRSFMFLFESNLASISYSHPVDGYNKFIDVRSFIDFLIINELSKNIDGYRFSTFMYKDKDSKGGKLTMGPVWDYNLGYGNVNYGIDLAWETYGWMYTFVYGGDDWNSKIFWWKRLMEDQMFRFNLQTRWLEVRQGILSDQYLINTIDSIKLYLDEAQERNFDKWSVLGNYVWPNYYIGQTYSQEVDWLSDWILDRLSWMDSQWNELVTMQKPDASEFLVYPNPFTTSLTLHCNIQTKGRIEIKIFNITGQLVRTVAQENILAGEHIFTWNGMNHGGDPVSPGVYIYTISLEGKTLAKDKIVKF